jgi:hypothetical protein
MDTELLQKIDASRDSEFLSDVVAKTGADSIYQQRAAAKLAQMWHAETRPRPFYKEWSFWLSLAALIVAIASLALSWFSLQR